MNILSVTKSVVVKNPQGLHARPADMLVRAASQFQCDITIARVGQDAGANGEAVDCKSILSLLTLGATQGTELSLSANGADADHAAQCIEQLFESGFSELEAT
ncbi:MAG: HPr family phosphocarrier protein [Planctomycetota bacterium]